MGLARDAIKWTFYAVGGYLLLAYATNAGKLMSSGQSFYTSGVKVLQGR